MPDTVHDGTPLGPVDTAWLHMEDPTNLMMVTGLFVLRTPLDLEELRETLRDRMIERFPRLRHRVRQAGSSAFWAADPTFDLAAHVHRLALPEPRGPQTLRDVVSDLMSTPLDASKPLWQCHLIEGVGEGCAVLMRLHHCIGDGVAMVHVLLSMTDRVAWVEPHLPRLGLGLALERHIADRVGWLVDQVSASAARVFETTLWAERLLEQGIGVVRHPSQASAWLQSARVGAGVALEMLMRPSDPQTPLKGPLGVSKRAAWSRSLRLSEVKRIGGRVGGTINDVLLAAVTGGLRCYLERRGLPTAGVEIHAMVPVNLRPPEQADELGNRFGLAYLALPVGVADRAERLRLVQERMAALKRSPEPQVGFQLLSVLGRAPRRLAERFIDLFGSKSTAVMTNVIGPRRPIYFDGRRIETLMFWVPQSGHMGLGVSIFSYDRRVIVGVASDRGLIPDPESIAEAFEAEFEALRQWADRPAPVPAALETSKLTADRAGLGPRRARRVASAGRAPRRNHGPCPQDARATRSPRHGKSAAPALLHRRRSRA